MQNDHGLKIRGKLRALCFYIVTQQPLIYYYYFFSLIWYINFQKERIIFQMLKQALIIKEPKYIYIYILLFYYKK